MKNEQILMGDSDFEYVKINGNMGNFRQGTHAHYNIDKHLFKL
jgi:hypothetical protein